MELGAALNLGEMQRYLNRVGDRWPLQVVMLGGARVDDARGAPPQRERGPEYVVVLVSRAFEGMPWLERVYQAASLWDGMEMGDSADVHCYTLDGVASTLTRAKSTDCICRVGPDAPAPRPSWLSSHA